MLREDAGSVLLERASVASHAPAVHDNPLREPIDHIYAEAIHWIQEVVQHPHIRAWQIASQVEQNEVFDRTDEALIARMGRIYDHRGWLRLAMAFASRARFPGLDPRGLRLRVEMELQQSDCPEDIQEWFRGVVAFRRDQYGT